jgi:transcriptional regulator with XRE-family HTH domain
VGAAKIYKPDGKCNISGANVREARQRAGLSQEQLAKLAGVNVQVLQQYERGARDLNGAKLLTLLKLCNALECGLADIITDKETREQLSAYAAH